jgi:LCP family protein required for cell wall assembly
VNEDDLRAAFARQRVEELNVNELRQSIDAEAGRRRRRRAVAWSSGLAIALALAIVVPLTLMRGKVPVVANLPIVGTSAPAMPVNILLLGLDARGTMDTNRTDTIVIMHIPADRSKIYISSIERDTAVEIPGHGQNKINAAYYFGGTKLVRETITKLTGVTFDATVALTFGAAKTIVDELGGVQVCLDRAVRSIHTTRTYPPGCQQLTGDQANDLIRQRQDLPNGGYDRDRNGHRVLAGIADRVGQLNLLTDLDRIVGLARTKGVTVEPGGEDLLALVRQLSGAKGAPVVGIGAPTFHSDGKGLETLRPEATDLFRSIIEDHVDTFVTANPTWVTSLR